MASVLDDKEAIREAFATYCYNVDDNKPEAFGNLFATDCVWDGGPIGKFEGREALVGFCAGINQQWGAGTFHHLLSNQIVSVNGDSAHLRAYVNVMKGKISESIAVFASGQYQVDFVRQGGSWLIKKLELTVL
jgi:ketosteroid isomerase-like protein